MFGLSAAFSGPLLDASPEDAAWNTSWHERFVRLLPETGVPSGLRCTDGRIRLIYAPVYLAFGFSQMAMPADRPIAVLPGSEPAPPWSSTSAPCCPWTPASAKAVAERIDHKLAGSDPRHQDPRSRDGLGRLPGRSLTRAWRAAAIPLGEDELLHTRRRSNPSVIYASGCIRGTLLPSTA